MFLYHIFVNFFSRYARASVRSGTATALLEKHFGIVSTSL